MISIAKIEFLLISVGSVSKDWILTCVSSMGVLLLTKFVAQTHCHKYCRTRAAADEKEINSLVWRILCYLSSD